MRFTIKLQTLPIGIIVFIDEPVDVILKKLKVYGLTEGDKEIIVNNPEGTMGWCVMLSNNAVIISVKQHEKRCDTVGIVAHESYRAVMAIVEYVGDKINPDSEEFCAYLIQYIISEIMKRIDNQKRKD